MASESVIRLTNEEFLKLKKNLSKYDKKSGGYSDVYFSRDKAYKVYNKVPYLQDNYGNIIFSEKDVLENLLYFKKNKFDGISNVNNIYLLDGFLVMYEMENINNMQNMKEIKEETLDVSLKELLSSWKSALNLAEKLSDKGIVMYDLKEDNAFIGNGNFKVCDVDFYKKESLGNLLNVNYMLVNTIFIEFIERYLFFENYECRKDDYLIETKNYADCAIEDLLLASGYSSKTLKEVAKNL